MVLRITVFVMMAMGLLGFGTVAWISMQPPAAAAGTGRRRQAAAAASFGAGRRA